MHLKAQQKFSPELVRVVAVLFLVPLPDNQPNEEDNCYNEEGTPDKDHDSPSFHVGFIRDSFMAPPSPCPDLNQTGPVLSKSNVAASPYRGSWGNQTGRMD